MKLAFTVRCGSKIANLADPPKCLPGQQAEYETSLFQPLSIFCSVVANPGKNLTFHWVLIWNTKGKH